MANVVREDIDSLNAILSITVTKDDYANNVNKTLKGYRQQATIKGFRKGKAPISLLKKMYGKSILFDEVNKALEKALNDYLVEQKLNLLGQPIPSETDENLLDFDIKNLDKEYVFKFDIGLAPEFELKGISSDNTFKYYDVQIEPEVIEDELKNQQKRNGENKAVEDELIIAGDLVQLQLKEMEGDAVKEGGIEKETFLSVDLIGSEELAAEILTKKHGDVFTVNINTLEKDRTPEDVRKFILGVEEDVNYNETFQAEVLEVKRQVDAELNQELFDKLIGEGKVSSLEEFKVELEKDIKAYYEEQADRLLYNEFLDNLFKENTLEFPEAFLERWLLMTNRNNAEVTPESIKSEMPNFLKGLQWQLIKEKIAEEFGVEVKDEDLKESFKESIKGYYGGGAAPGMDDKFMDTIVENFMKDPNYTNQRREELFEKQLVAVAKKQVTFEKEEIASKAFIEIIKAQNEEVRAKEAAEAAAQEATVSDAEIVAE